MFEVHSLSGLSQTKLRVECPPVQRTQLDNKTRAGSAGHTVEVLLSTVFLEEEKASVVVDK